MLPFRKTIFWLHLVSGVSAGLIIAIMSITGIAIAFEKDILRAVDSKATQVTIPENAGTLSIAELETRLTQESPSFQPTTLTIFREPDRAYEFRAGRESTLMVNPYTGASRPLEATAMHGILRTLKEWHRWLGASGDARPIGRMITGVSNLLFLVLCLTGLYLWFPKRLARAAFRRILWFVPTQESKVRHFNLHNVFGFWALPFLVVIIVSGAVISFGWAHRLVFQLAGEEAPDYGGYRTSGITIPTITAPPDSERMALDSVLQGVKEEYPTWKAITYTYPKASESPLDIAVFEPTLFEVAGRVQLYMDPYTGEKLSAITFADRTPGVRARFWLRYLHTGEALGLPGKIVATLATAASLVLVYTGFALAFKRFRRMKQPKA